jgi:hypothetical protein
VDEVALTKTGRGDVPSSSEASFAIVERLGVMPLAIGLSHSPFLSCAAELAKLFVDATLTFPVRPIRPA